MPVVTARRPAPTRPTRKHPKLTLALESGRRLDLHYAPQTIELGGWSPSFVDADRPGRQALTLRSGEPKPTMSFDALLAYPNPQQTVEHTLKALREMAASRERMSVIFGPSAAGLWRLVGASVSSEELQEGTNAITRAVVSLSFTRAVDLTVKVGPMSGGVKPPTGRTGAPRPATAPRTYTVKAGDTLTGIAVRIYRSESRWRDIAKANGITDPRKLRVGQVLKLPA